MRDYMRERYRRRKAQAVELLGGRCWCGRTEQLEIDHIDWRTKTMKMDRMAWVSEERFLAELKKCQVLCNEHHIEKSRKDISEIRKEQEMKKRLKRGGSQRHS
jgi:hypothetical protein